MKKRVFYTIIILLVIISTSTCVLTSLVYYKFYEKETKDQIKTIVNLTSNNINDWSDNTHIQNSVYRIAKSVNYKIRVTIIEKTGDVIYDNFAKYEILENHRNRPEIEKAFSIGYGEDIRFSNTLKNDTYYYAVKLDDNTVLRMSREIRSIRNMFISITPILMVFFLIIVLISFIVASNITNKIIKPIDLIANSLDDLLEEDKFNFKISMYDELRPFAHKIREQKQKINEYIKELKYERDTIGNITENMREGFILLNKEREILSINVSGKRMIGNLNFNLNEHKNVIELTRNIEILKNVDTSMKGNRHIVYDVDHNSHHYRYYFSPVAERDNNVDGLMILIEDVTIQKKSEIIRREFSANVSHELKTPLTTMIGFAEMIKEGLITDSESIKKYCGMINNEGLRLITLIEDIIRLSKIEEGIDIDDNKIVNLKDVSGEVFNLLSAKANSRNIKLLSNIDNVSIKANKSYINELLYNLVDNSIKYNNDGGKVVLNINRNKGAINIVVKDSGLGISEEHLDRIFERFYRVDKSRSKETGGTGLGLSIVKHIVEAYHGIIEIKSKEDEGTEIKIKFPDN